MKTLKYGFTLMELAVVVAIVGILGALMMPGMATMLIQSQIQSKADALAAAVQLARAEAFKRNTPVTLQFGPVGTGNSTGGYTIGCAATVFNSGALASLKASCPGSRYSSDATFYTTAAAIYRQPPEGGSGGAASASSKFIIDFDQDQTVPTLTFDGFGNLMANNPDSTVSIKEIRIMPGSNFMAGGCQNRTSNTGTTASQCRVDIRISDSGGTKVCIPTADSTSPKAC